MNADTITIDDYIVTIARDPFAENPFTNWGCEPALLVYSYDRHPRLDTYQGAPETLTDFVALIPGARFARGGRLHILRALKPEKYGWKEWLKDIARKRSEWTRYIPHYTPLRDAIGELLTDIHGAKPEGWRFAGEWFDLAGMILSHAGITFHFTESRGYCQGDVVKLMAIALPSWVETVGAPVESLPGQCKSACGLYGSWVWGDVYGIESITDPSGNDLEDASVWGFYGSDHEKSGLLGSARDSIDYDKEQKITAKAERHELRKLAAAMA